MDSISARFVLVRSDSDRSCQSCSPSSKLEGIRSWRAANPVSFQSYSPSSELDGLPNPAALASERKTKRDETKFTSTRPPMATSHRPCPRLQCVNSSLGRDPSGGPTGIVGQHVNWVFRLSARFVVQASRLPVSPTTSWAAETAAPQSSPNVAENWVLLWSDL